MLVELYFLLLAVRLCLYVHDLHNVVVIVICVLLREDEVQYQSHKSGHEDCTDDVLVTREHDA